jgi:hypothetical protein
LPTKVQIAEAVIREQKQEREFEGEVDDGLWVGVSDEERDERGEDEAEVEEEGEDVDVDTDACSVTDGDGDDHSNSSTCKHNLLSSSHDDHYQPPESSESAIDTDIDTDSTQLSPEMAMLETLEEIEEKVGAFRRFTRRNFGKMQRALDWAMRENVKGVEEVLDGVGRELRWLRERERERE